MRLVHFKARKRHRNPARRRSRSYRRNPVSLKAVMAPATLIQVTEVTVGFGIGAKVGGMIYNKMFSGTGALAKLRRVAGLVTFALGAAAASASRNEHVKKVGTGIAVAGIYDVISQNIPQAGFKPVNGESFDVAGNVELVGDDDDGEAVYDGESIDVSGDMTELVGDDADTERIYA